MTTSLKIGETFTAWYPKMPPLYCAPLIYPRFNPWDSIISGGLLPSDALASCYILLTVIWFWGSELISYNGRGGRHVYRGSGCRPHCRDTAGGKDQRRWMWLVLNRRIAIGHECQDDLVMDIPRVRDRVIWLAALFHRGLWREMLPIASAV
jgi:hypothetical protein